MCKRFGLPSAGKGFVEVENDDFTLGIGSPAIDEGKT